MDILLYMSDQHSYRLQGYAGDPVVRTPNLDRIAASGTVFDNAMTACPLCVPARAAMISGLLPSNNGVLFNFNAISSDLATFLHSLNASGYDTVLCGRMHFVGPDQRHGYSRRFAGDRTPVFHNNPRPDPRPTPTRVRGYDENSSVYYIGAGDSPVLAYDRYVVKNALDYLAMDHEKPQFITVGTYGPHFPYVAPKELYDYYYDKVSLDDVDGDYAGHPVLEGKMQETDPEVVRAARAAYYGLTEQQDRHIGEVYDAFQAYLKRTGREGIFLYTSDHGDMNGTHGYFGKQVFYEPSIHIPFLLAGDGVPAGVRNKGAVSLLDIGKTVCGFAGARVLKGDGEDLSARIREGKDDPDRMVVSEQYTYLSNGDTSLGRLVRRGEWKYFTYSGFEDHDQLFDLESDPGEHRNLLRERPELVKELREALNGLKSYDAVMEHENWVMEQLRILRKCDFDDTEERWVPPQDLSELENPIRSKRPFAPVAWAVQMRKKLEG